MTTAEQFFFNASNAPIAHRVKLARTLAEAEAYAKANGWTFRWVGDSDADPYDWSATSVLVDPELDAVNRVFSEGCVLYDARGEALESLWGIWDATADYGRVVEAELALEAMGKAQAAIALDHVLA